MNLTEKQLAERWNVGQSTLRAWRAEGRGPKHLRLNQTTIRYPLAWVEDYEKGAIA